MYYTSCLKVRYLKKTLKAIVDKEYHFVSQVQNNQKSLLEQIKFNINIPDTQAIDTYIENDFNTHGRIETREVKVYDDLYLIENNWDMVNRIITVYSTITIRNKTTNETRYYISDLTKSAIDFAYIIRSHPAIENSLHYVKDLAFLEDFNRMRTKQIPQIASLIKVKLLIF